MKKILSIVLTLLVAGNLSAQTIGNEAYPSLNKSLLNINLKKPGQTLRIGGFVSASASYTDIRHSEVEWGFDVNHANLSLEGQFAKEKFGFFLQADFADSYPLLDAYVSFQPWKVLKITAGQRPTLTNNRSMLMLDQGLAFAQRSLLDRTFSDTGRELGLYLESRLPLGPVGLELGAAVTSGDGRNSFGSSSTDPDKGGLKYGGRVTLYPLGFFRPGNEQVFNDFCREKSPKLAIGAAYSFNDGVSNSVGEGHGDFVLYDVDGKEEYPSLRKFTVDALLKWQGFSLLAEYVNTTGTSLNKIYTRSDGQTKLKPRQISEYLTLGEGFNLQAGYLGKCGLALDAGYSKVKPEWDATEAPNSLLREADNFTAGLSKYLCKNQFKVQLAGSYTKYKKIGDVEPNNEIQASINLQVIF